MGIYGQTYRFSIGPGLTPAVKFLLISNVAVFLLQNIFPHFFDNLALNKSQVLSDFAWWQLVTYMFLHGDLWHILFNMLVLWMIGSELEQHWGSKQFLIYYFLCGVGAGLFNMIFAPPDVKVLGASGAVYGLLAAFGYLFPERVITLLLFFILPVQIKVKYLVIGLAAISVFFGVFGQEAGVAHFAHLGGMLVGFLYLRLHPKWSGYGRRSYGGMGIYSSKGSSSSARFPKLRAWFQRRLESRRRMELSRRRQRELHLRERVDAILDKINEVGYDNLSEDEKEVLRKASRMLSQEDLRSQDFGPN